MAALGHYITWLRSQGGQCRSGIGADPEIGMVPVTKLISPDGTRHVIHPSGDQAEELSTYTIEYFDRRLGVLSPFRGVPRA
jgi:hypothetical protein